MVDLTPQEQQLLNIIRQANGEVTRSELAAAQNKARLNVWDVKLLSDLVDFAAHR